MAAQQFLKFFYLEDLAQRDGLTLMITPSMASFSRTMALIMMVAAPAAGEAMERLVHRLLKQVAADVVRQADLDDVTAFPVLPVKLGCAAGIPWP